MGDCEWATGFMANVGVHRRKFHGIKSGIRGRPRTLTNAPPEEKEKDIDDYDEEAQRTEIWYAWVGSSIPVSSILCSINT